MSAGTEAIESIRSLIVALANGQLILPYSLVQEIIVWEEPTPIEDSPEWLLGQVQWRRWKLPVVSAERLAGEDLSHTARKAHIVVCSLLRKDDEMPCVGIVAQGVPQIATADSATIVALEEASEMEWAAAQMNYKGQRAWVPDFTALAKALTAS